MVVLMLYKQYNFSIAPLTCMPTFIIFLSGSDLSPQPKWRLDWFSRFCTAHDSVVWHARACPFP